MKRPLERGMATFQHRVTVSNQHELDRKIEQRTQAGEGFVEPDAGREPRALEAERRADERVAREECTLLGEPEHGLLGVVRGRRDNAAGKRVTGVVSVRLDVEPGAAASWYVDRRAEPVDAGGRAAAVPRAGQYDRDGSPLGEPENPFGRQQRIEQDQLVRADDRRRDDVLAPAFRPGVRRRPLRVRRRPRPQSRSQLLHGL